MLNNSLRIYQSRTIPFAAKMRSSFVMSLTFFGCVRSLYILSTSSLKSFFTITSHPEHVLKMIVYIKLCKEDIFANKFPFTRTQPRMNLINSTMPTAPARCSRRSFPHGSARCAVPQVRNSVMPKRTLLRKGGSTEDTEKKFYVY